MHSVSDILLLLYISLSIIISCYHPWLLSSVCLSVSPSLSQGSHLARVKTRFTTNTIVHYPNTLCRWIDLDIAMEGTRRFPLISSPTIDITHRNKLSIVVTGPLSLLSAIPLLTTVRYGYEHSLASLLTITINHFFFHSNCLSLPSLTHASLSSHALAFALNTVLCLAFDPTNWAYSMSYVSETNQPFFLFLFLSHSYLSLTLLCLSLSLSLSL